MFCKFLCCLELSTGQQLEYFKVESSNQREAPSLETSDLFDGGAYLTEQRTGESWLPIPCKSAVQRREVEVAPQYRLISSRLEGSPQKSVTTKPLEVEREVDGERELKPLVKYEVETFTVKYPVTVYRTKVFTKKRKFIQRRTLVKERINKPVLLVKRKFIKERKVFEKLIPKIVETRQIINNPQIQDKIIKGPVVEEYLPECETEQMESRDGDQIRNAEPIMDDGFSDQV